MKKNNFTSLFLWLVVLLSGCSEIIAPDISQETVIALTPADGALVPAATVPASANELSLPANTITFWWEPLSSETNYQLQVVSPSFEAPAYLVLDTLVADNKLDVQLGSGIYAWRVRADNGAYQTAFSAANQFSIEKADADSKTIQLIYPSPDFVTNASLIGFSWQAFDETAQYSLNITSEHYRLDTVVAKQAVDVLLPRKDHVLEWQIKMVCDNCPQDVISAKRTLVLDYTPPQAPELKEPAKNAIVAKDNIRFSWDRSEENIVADILYLYDADSTLLPGFPVVVDENTYRGALPSAGFYYWQVRSTDQAGNLGSTPALRKFQVI